MLAAIPIKNVMSYEYYRYTVKYYLILETYNNISLVLETSLVLGTYCNVLFSIRDIL